MLDLSLFKLFPWGFAVHEMPRPAIYFVFKIFINRFFSVRVKGTKKIVFLPWIFFSVPFFSFQLSLRAITEWDDLDESGNCVSYATDKIGYEGRDHFFGIFNPLLVFF